ncbi:MAG TPA: hypothetical protein VHC68_01305 [Candidatus Paceibacterota bacterium]|nr:hypothetical protein [Candidatus Paceibacterota bacterium]
MDLRIFGPVWDGCGVRGFSGEGYWFHKLVPNLSFKGSTLVAKTITAFPNKGNMLLTADYQPYALFPDCIDARVIGGRALNAVGLSNPGIKAFLATERWQHIAEPFFVSFMPIGKTDEEQERETEEFAIELKIALRSFESRFVALQFNLTCPNVGADLSKIVEKAKRLLPILAKLGIPIVVKINLTVAPEAAAEIAQMHECAGLCLTNTIPFGEMPHDISWSLVYPNGSPLEKRDYGKGGLSGSGLAPLVADWIRRFRTLDATTYINGGGGIMRPSDVDLIREAGADSIFFTTVAMLRPWRVRSIIERGHELAGKSY